MRLISFLVSGQFQIKLSDDLFIENQFVYTKNCSSLCVNIATTSFCEPDKSTCYFNKKSIPNTYMNNTKLDNLPDIFQKTKNTSLKHELSDMAVKIKMSRFTLEWEMIEIRSSWLDYL